MLMTNLYGSIVSNVVCGLLGGAGLLSGRNYGDHYAVFEPGTRNTGMIKKWSVRRDWFQFLLGFFDLESLYENIVEEIKKKMKILITKYTISSAFNCLFSFLKLS